MPHGALYRGFKASTCIPPEKWNLVDRLTGHGQPFLSFRPGPPNLDNATTTKRSRLSLNCILAHTVCEGNRTLHVHISQYPRHAQATREQWTVDECQPAAPSAPLLTATPNSYSAALLSFNPMRNSSALTAPGDVTRNLIPKDAG